MSTRFRLVDGAGRMWLVLAVSLIGSRVCTGDTLEDKYNVTNEIRNVDTNYSLENENKTVIPTNNFNLTLLIKKLLYNESHSQEITTTEADSRRNYPNVSFRTEHTTEGTDVITYNDTQKEANINETNGSLSDDNNSYQNIYTQKIRNNIKPKMIKKSRLNQTKNTRKASKKFRKRHNRENKQKLKDLKKYVIKEINISVQNNDTYESAEINKTYDVIENNSTEELKKNTTTEIMQSNRMEDHNNKTNMEHWKARELYQITENSMHNITNNFTESLAGQVGTSNKTDELYNGTIELRKIYKRNELNEYNNTKEERNITKKEVILEIINKVEESHNNNESRDKNNEVTESNKIKEVGDYINIDEDISKNIETQQIGKRDKGQEYYSPDEKRNTYIEQQITFEKNYENEDHKINDNNHKTNKLPTINKIDEIKENISINEVRNNMSETKIDKMKKHLKYNSTEIDISKVKDNNNTTVEVKYSKITNSSFDNMADALKALNLTNKDKDNNGSTSEVKNLKKDGFLANNVNQTSTPKPVRQVIDYNNMMIDLISRYNAKANALKLSPGSLDRIITHRHESTYTNSKFPNEMSSEIVYAEPGKYMRNTMYIQKLMKGFINKWPQDFDNRLPNRMSRHMYGDELSDTNFDGAHDALEVRIKKLRSQMFEILLTIEQIKRSLEEKDNRNERGIKNDKKINSSLKVKQFDKLWRQLYSNYLNETNISSDSHLKDVMQNIKDDDGSFVNMFKKIFYFLTKRRFNKIDRNQRDSPVSYIPRSNLNNYEFLKANPYYEIRNLKNLLKTFNIVHKKFIQNIIDAVENIERKNTLMIENEKKELPLPDDLELIVEKRCAKMKKMELLNDAGEHMSRRRRNISNIEDTALRYILTLVDVLLNETPESEDVVDNANVTTDETKKLNKEEMLTHKAVKTSTTRTEADTLYTETDDHVTKSQGKHAMTPSPIETHTEVNIDNYDMSEDKQYMYVSQGTPTTREVAQVNELVKDQLMEKETESYNTNFAKETSKIRKDRLTEKQREALDKSSRTTTTVKSVNNTEKDREPMNTNLSLETNTFQAIPSRKFYFYSNDYEQDVSTVPEPKKGSTKKVNILKEEMRKTKKQKDDIHDSDENTTGKASVNSLKDYDENNDDEFVKTTTNKTPNQSKQKHMPKKVMEEPREIKKQEDEIENFDENPIRIANSSFKLFRDYMDLLDYEIDTTTDIVKTVTKIDSPNKKISTHSSTTEHTDKRKGENTRLKQKDPMIIEEEGVRSNSINQQYNNGYHFNSEGLLESVTDEPETHTITNKILMRKNTVLLDSLDYGLISTDINETNVTTNKSKNSNNKNNNNKIDIRKKEVSSDEVEMAKTKLPKYFFEYQESQAENADGAGNSVREVNPDASQENKLSSKTAEEKNDSVKQITTEFERDDDNDKGNYAIDREEGFQDPGEIEESPAYF